MRNDFDGIVIQDRRAVSDAVACHNLRVIGVAEFLSDVEANFVDILGEACFDVDLSCDKLTVRGRCVCKCGILASSVRVFGKAAVYGRIHAETVIVLGAFKFRSKFSASSLVIKSGAYVKGSAKLRVSKCVINGSMNNAGVLASQSVIIQSNKPSDIQEIHCEDLTVSTHARVSSSENIYGYTSDMANAEGAEFKEKINQEDSMHDFTLTSDFIDCYTADLESCNIEKLYCDSAIIRKGCVIHEILYKDSIEIEQGARVERLSKT